MSISDLDRKITYSRKDDFDKLQSISLYAHDESESSSQNLKALKVTSSGDLKVDISSGSGSHGLATEEKQNTMISELEDMSVKCLGNTEGDGSGDFKHLHLDGNGNVNSQIINTVSVNAFRTNISDGSTNSHALVDGDGKIVVSDGSIITSDGDTSGQRVMILANHNGNLRTVKCGDGGALATESDHSWDNTNTLINIVSTPAGATITSTTFDLGQGVSHELGAVEFFLTNSASLDVEVTPEVSPNGTVWYFMANPMPVSTSKQYVSFSQEEIGISVGHRYMRFQVTNNDATNSTDITLIAGYYK